MARQGGIEGGGGWKRTGRVGGVVERIVTQATGCEGGSGR